MEEYVYDDTGEDDDIESNDEGEVDGDGEEYLDENVSSDGGRA